MSGVGTRLKARFEWWGVRSGGNCGCDKLAQSMDGGGPDWCEANRDAILDQIRGNATQRGLPFVRPVVSALLSSCIADEREYLAQRAAIAATCFEERVQRELDDLRAGWRVREPRWQWTPEAIEAIRRVTLAGLDRIRQAEPPQYGPGCGIVTLAGGVRYFPAVYVLAKMLRGVGCRLPIECWYLDRRELDPSMGKLLAEYDVECVDGSQRLLGQPRAWRGWEAKAWAIQHSAFREVLYLDADIVPTCDPARLFTDAAYLERGAVAWPNFDHAVSYCTSAEAWHVCGLEAPQAARRFDHHTKPTEYVPWETGQLLVDKSRHWRAIEAAKLMSDYSDWWYPPPNGKPNDWHSYGDTGTFQLAFEAIGELPAMAPACTMFGTSQGGGLNQHDFAGSVVWQHRTMPSHKVGVTRANPSTGLVLAAEFDAACADARAKWRGAVWRWEDQTPHELAKAKHRAGDYFAVGLPVAKPRINLGTRGQVDGGRLHHWRVWVEGNETRLVVADSVNGQAILRATPTGWEGDGVRLIRSAPAWWDGIQDESAAIQWATVGDDLPERMDGWTVVDIGAGEGIWSYAALERGAAAVWAVEADQRRFARLVRNIGDRPGVVCLHRYVWPDGERDWMDHGGRVEVMGIERLLSLAGKVDRLRLGCGDAAWAIRLRADLSAAPVG